MAYSALYRRYRPETFGEIVGQPHITTILQNQIRTGRVAHAYLFSGSRGTGKTSTARIFARAINCLEPVDGEPCGRCAACLEADGVDVIEIDAASNSRVEEMRALIERAELAPLKLGRKVYIIDEAHMLTKNASNALLKTLEEPPAHVVFILATTEPQMLPPTIVSRCQRFEFHRLSVSDMVSTMRSVLERAGAHIDDDGLAIIARAAEGGMRDCLSIADQCLSFCGSDISADDVLTVLGSVNTDFLRRMADAVIKSDTSLVMRYVGEMVESGRDIGVFTLDLANHFRALLLAKVCGSCTDILDCTAERMNDYIEQAQGASKERLERALEELLRLQPTLRLVTMPRVLLESTLMRICRPQDSNDMLALSDRVRELEDKLKNGLLMAASSKQDDKRQPTSKPVKPDYELVPDATPDGDEMYGKLLDHLASPDGDRSLYAMLGTSKAHWTAGGVLHICFDAETQGSYGYVSSRDMRAVLNGAANKCISPYRVEVEIRLAGEIKQNRKNSFHNVKIEEE